MIESPIFAISRHRLTVDGVGVTTLVTFLNCPLRCKYCLNPQCFSPKTKYQNYTPKQLFDIVVVDQLYFLATGGGICFGGGEAGLYPDFIKEFRNICGNQWSLTIETSLNIPIENLKTLISCVDAFIIDIKDINNHTYYNYTKKNNFQVIENLKYLKDNFDIDKITIRIPLIPNFNTKDDQQKSKKFLEELGFKNFDIFDYVIR